MASRTVSIRIDEDLLEAAGEAADAEGISRNAFIERAVLDRVRFSLTGIEITQPGQVIRLFRTRGAEEALDHDDVQQLMKTLADVAERLGMEGES